ncbi:hypothetical protein PIB30_109572, partial [Stylosanthes scabra]|nr:hypothetical protein [Stylosanthes scabra]
MRGRARICVLYQDKSTPKQLCHARAWQPSPSSARIGVETTPRRGGPASSHKTTHMRDPDITKPQSSTHRRRRPTHMRGRNSGSKQPRMTHAEVVHA